MAEFFGWAAVQGPDAMSWPEYAAARQYVLEQRIGTHVRDAKRHEDAKFRSAAKAIGRQR